jgi:hypothetical protein
MGHETCRRQDASRWLYARQYNAREKVMQGFTGRSLSWTLRNAALLLIALLGDVRVVNRPLRAQEFMIAR